MKSLLGLSHGNHLDVQFYRNWAGSQSVNKYRGVASWPAEPALSKR